MSLTSLLSQFAAETGCVDTVVFGQVCDNCNGSATMQILSYIVRLMTYGVGILAVIGIMVFGIKYLISRGNEDLAIKARRHLYQVLIGLVSYIVLVFAASWLLPGNLTTTMLGGSPGSCPEITETEITVIGRNEEEETVDPISPGNTPLPEDWKTGTRPRECGPGEPGNPGELVTDGLKTKKGTFPLYTNSAGRTFARYSQGDSRWSNERTPGGRSMASAGCTATSLAMLGESFASVEELKKEGDGEHIYPKGKYTDQNPSHNYVNNGQTTCRQKDKCNVKEADKIKKTIDKGGAIFIHACGHWSSSKYSVCNYRSSHYFLLVDYRVKNGKLEFFFLNTSEGKWHGGKSGSGWGTFDFADSVEDYTLYYKKPVGNWDCKVRSR